MPAHVRAFRNTGNQSAGLFLIPRSLDIGTAIEELPRIWLSHVNLLRPKAVHFGEIVLHSIYASNIVLVRLAPTDQHQP